MNFLRTEHYIIGEQAFTKDGILIHNIRGHSMSTYSTNITHEDLKTYFEKFGEILNADLQGESGRKYFVIEFSNPQSAAKALQNRVHCIGDQEYAIHACCSLEQLDDKKIMQQLNAALRHNSILNNESFWNSSFQKGEEAPIFALNDDCLGLIFKFLTLPDQIYLAASCKRFCTVFAWLCTARYKTLHTDSLRKLTPLRIGIFLQIVGPVIKTLILNVLGFVYQSDHYVKFVGTYCTNVENLTLIKCFKWGGFSISRFLKKMTSLEELTLYLTDSDENFSEYLRAFKNFRTLKIFSSRITDSEIHTVTGLEKLVLKDLERRAPDLRVLFRSLTNLSYLDVRTVLLELEAFQLIAKHLLQLTTLRITYSKGNFIALAELPKLKMLELQLEPYIVKTSKKCAKDLHLAASMAQQLEEFRIATYSIFNQSWEIASCLSKLENLKVLHWKIEASDEILAMFSQLAKLEELFLGSCVEITDKGVLSLLKNCSKLRRICFSNLNVNEIDRILSSSLELLQEQRSSDVRDECVHFVLEASFYKRHLQKFSRGREFLDVLEITPDDFKSEEARLFLLSVAEKPL